MVRTLYHQETLQGFKIRMTKSRQKELIQGEELVFREIIRNPVSRLKGLNNLTIIKSIS